MGKGRYLIVNADDLGYSAAINEGVFAAHEGGIVTSTSLMVLGAEAPAAAEALPAYPDLAVGLHLERRSSFPLSSECRCATGLFATSATSTAETRSRPST